MADDKDRIEQIRERRRRDTVQISTQRQDSTQVSAPAVNEVSTDQNLLGVDFKSPWLKDRVTLSLEGQLAMVEQRGNYRSNLVDLGYTNRQNILPLRQGIYIKIEPTGGYRKVYNDR